MPYPPIEPFEHGMLDVGQDNRIYWEICGNPSGKPVLVLHGGPGSGCSPFLRQLFDPAIYRIVLLDQRGCGRSTPHAGDLTTSLQDNTTWHLLDDIEALRSSLCIEQWLVFGISWGATLALAYAEQNPAHVSALVLSGATMTRRREIDWLYRGVAPMFPAQWERFRQGVPLHMRDSDLVEAYFQLLHNPDQTVRTQAARNWHAWDNASLSAETTTQASVHAIDHRRELARARIITHYFRNAAWLEDNALLENADKLSSIPGVMIQGQLDLAAPMVTAWELSKVWPNAELVTVALAGHSLRDSGIAEAIVKATDKFGKAG